jgi:hypothetical protein
MERDDDNQSLLRHSFILLSPWAQFLAAGGEKRQFLHPLIFPHLVLLLDRPPLISSSLNPSEIYFRYFSPSASRNLFYPFRSFPVAGASCVPVRGSPVSVCAVSQQTRASCRFVSLPIGTSWLGISEQGPNPAFQGLVKGPFSSSGWEAKRWTIVLDTKFKHGQQPRLS